MNRPDATTTSRSGPRPRLGFTLVELLVVIVIIGILVALLVPAILAGVRKGREARIAGEIDTMAQALEQFKNKHGEYPPSRVILSETGIYSITGAFTPQPADYSTALNSPSITWYGTAPTSFGDPDISFGELASRSLRALRKFFPRAILAPQDRDGGGLNSSADYWPDYNGNAGVSSNAPDAGIMYLEGYECFAFFLGGIPTPLSDGKGGINYGASGFGKDPLYPFKNAGIDPTLFISTTNRNAPFFEFKGERLTDHDGDGIPGYLDPNGSDGQGLYYAYFATYGSVGYDPNDVNAIELDDSGNLVGTFFRVGLPVANRTTFSPGPNPYTTSLPTPVSGTMFNGSQSSAYQKPSSFQIISAGGDGLFGMGGQYTSSANKLPMPPRPADTPPGPYTLQGGNAIANDLRVRENDNVTNFTQGRIN